MNIVAIIPARKGSKRLRHKNIYPLQGKPLIEYSIEAALSSKYIDETNLFISTDFDEVVDIANKFQVKVVDRPPHLALDDVWTQDVVNHLDDTLQFLKDDDLIIIVQANSPQVTPQVIDECITKLIEHQLWEVNTVDSNLINNGAVQVIRKRLRNHSGKANYNGVVITDWVDVHTLEDINYLESIL